MGRVLLRVAYDGTNYNGWQVQDNGRTIEGELNKALTDIAGEEIVVIGASRTDAGVHALDNIAVFDYDGPLPADRFMYALNARLPEDIRVQNSYEVTSDYHPRKRTTIKTYEYSIYSAKVELPIVSRYSYHTFYSVDVEKMRDAAKYLVGEHDFKSFCNVKTSATTTVREVVSIDIDVKGSMIVLRISGKGFLYNMVRIIAGTLLEVGRGALTPEDVKKILDGCDRTLAGPTLPPCGLMLMSIAETEDENSNISDEECVD